MVEWEFEWDENKREENIQKHGLDFLDAAYLMLTGNHVVVPAYAGSDSERYLMIGYVQQKCCTATYTLRGQKKRIISFRRSRVNEERKYRELFGK